MSIIKFEYVKKFYNQNTPAEVHALKGITLEIEKGELVAIIGPSGSGKSTLLHIIGCLDNVSAGIFSLDGKNTFVLSSKELALIRNKKIGFVLQEFGLIMEDTVLENVSVPLIFGDTKYKDIYKKCYKVLKDLKIDELEKKPVSQLSGGQRQRVAIARALVNDPDIILADEPTGALDTATSADIMNIIVELNKLGKTIIIVTHNPEVANRCNRVIQIIDGLAVE